MSLPSLLPRALWSLLLLFPGILLSAWEISCRVTPKRRLRELLTPGLAAVMWLVCTHLAGRVLRSYTGAVVAGTAVPGLVGYALALWRLTRPARAPAPASPPEPRYSPWMYVGMAVGTALIFPAAWNWCFHDEAGATGHLALIYEMQRGIYPPRNLTFPQLEMPYHYGFDVAAAFVSTIFDLTPLHAIDVVTMTSWAYSWCLFWAIGHELFGRGGGPACAFLTLLGGGFPYYCAGNFNASTTLSGHLANVCFEGESLLNPTLISYFFQHPWSFGIPLVGLVGLWLAASKLRSRFDYLVAFLLLVALDISQFAAWSAIMPILGVAILLGAKRQDGRRLVGWLILLGGVFLLARYLGGFWSHHHTTSFSLRVHAGINASLLSTLLWNLRTFGPLLVGLVGIPFLDRANRPRVFYAQVALGGMLICNIFVYGKSWDIVKFATFASIGFGVLTAGVVVRWLRSRLVLARVAAVTTLIASGLSAFGFLLIVDADLSPASVGWIFSCSEGMVGAENQAADWLRRHMRPSDVMYRSASASGTYVTYAGIAQMWLGNAPALPIPDDLIASRTKLIDTLPPDPQPYRHEGLRYFVIDGADGKLEKIVRSWEARGLAHERARFDFLRIVEI